MKRIGGSDVAKLLGCSRYGGPSDVYDRCVLGLEGESSAFAKRGQREEPRLRGMAHRFGFELQEHFGTGENRDYYEHPDNDFAHAQIDSLAIWKGQPVVLDFKTTLVFPNVARQWGPDGSDQVPEHIHAQVAWGMSCTNRDLSVLVVAFGVDVTPEEFEIDRVVTYFVERDPVFESYCLAVGREFWETHVRTGVRPEQSQTRPKRKKAS